jgi:16S rRNA (guanine(527)-N(7))-methyltransferase GidB
MTQVEELIGKYFPDCSAEKREQFAELCDLYKEWNEKINVISRKDIDNVFIHHILHSLAIAKVLKFKDGTKILDVGTGGGFPGVPLAVMFPQAHFTLVDSVGKKIKVASQVSGALGLKNVDCRNERVEKLHEEYDFVVSRAVTTLDEFVSWVANKVSKVQRNDIPNGLLYMKGGDLTKEIEDMQRKSERYLHHRPKVKLYDVHNVFDQDYFEEKKIVYIRL